jgi:hypothetical protein
MFEVRYQIADRTALLNKRASRRVEFLSKKKLRREWSSLLIKENSVLRRSFRKNGTERFFEARSNF